jgi:deoxyribonuclease-4
MNLQVGFHVSIAGGISNSVDNALALKCSAFQIFSRNPRGWAAKPLEEEDVKTFRAKLDKSSIKRDSVIVHMPYLPNLSAPDGELYTKSVDTLTGEVERCIALGIPSLVIHLGSHLGKGTNKGINQIVKACDYALHNYDKSSGSPDGDGLKPKRKKDNPPVRILLENMAGQKNSIGSKFEEIRDLLDALKGKGSFGVCLDTCHLFVAGYNLRKEKDVDGVLDHFDSAVGLKEIKALHLNDSKTDLNSKTDRHEHIGLGKIGKAGFAAILKQKSLIGIPMIMETPIDDRRANSDNLKLVLQLARNKRN